jgi:hypothetical protein
MKTMDRKMAARRHGVTEQRAATRLRLLILAVGLVGLAAAAFWLVRSPLLEVDRVEISGAQHSEAAAVIERLGVTSGTPTISVDASALETALRADPWIADASVVVTWPGSVDVEVTEHIPIAAVQVPEGFAHVTAAGQVVQMLDEPAGIPLITIPADAGPVRAGVTIGGPALPGALEFASALPPELAAVTIVAVDGSNQLSAVVGDYEVRLGRAIDMRSKAAALLALIAYGVEPGSSIDVTAARRPAVSNPQGQLEG